MEEDKLDKLKKYFDSAKRGNFLGVSSPKSTFYYALENLEMLNWDVELAIKYHNMTATKDELNEIFAIMEKNKKQMTLQ